MERAHSLSESERVNQALAHVAALPSKILNLHVDEQGHLAEFVLASLCDSTCCDIAKAALVINNPDFNCCCGAAGYLADEISSASNFATKETFERMCSDFDASLFHAKVRALNHTAYATTNEDYQQLVQELGFSSSAQICTMQLKNGNRGIFVYEPKKKLSDMLAHFIPLIISLFGFCPLI